MKLYYYQDPHGNFGDDLNLWLWPHLLPGIFDEGHDTLFLGIGTLLNHRVPQAPRKVVLGAGVGYGQPPAIDERWDVYGVRGPLSAQRLGLDAHLAVGDPAVLVRTIAHTDQPKRYPLSFMPHHVSARRANWRLFCRLAGIHYIDPRDDIFSVIRALQQSELVMTEAMHGAIVADALRTPWIAMRLYNYIDPFKWRDWAASMEVAYAPVGPKVLIDQERGLRAKVRRRLKPAVMAAGLHHMAACAEPQLSDDAVLGRVIERLSAEIDRLGATYNHHRYGLVRGRAARPAPATS